MDYVRLSDCNDSEMDVIVFPFPLFLPMFSISNLNLKCRIVNIE